MTQDLGLASNLVGLGYDQLYTSDSLLFVRPRLHNHTAVTWYTTGEEHVTSKA